ncbi:MAG: ABC transporter permease [Acidobacteriota bacterium]|jgi:ABC-2 type transport system permease protein
MRRTWAVARKELRQVVRDPLSLIMLIGLPAFMLVLYGYALNFDVRHIALAVQDRDHSVASRDLIAAFVNSTYFDVVATPAPGQDLEVLTERLQAKAILVIPEDFGADLGAGRAASVQLLLDGADATTATTILGYASGLVAQANERLLRGSLSRMGITLEPGIAYEPRVWYNPELESTQFLVPGLIGFLLMLTAVLATALSVVREKERGTMEQLRVAPLRTWELILGKTLPYLAISYLAAIIILVAARLLFDVQVEGSSLALFVATLVYLFGALGLGVLISTIADTQALAFQISLITSMLPALLLSGFIFQIRSMPLFLQAITYLVPARYYLVILRGVILKGTTLEPYWDQFLALVIFAVVMVTLASVRLARKEQ